MTLLRAVRLLSGRTIDDVSDATGLHSVAIHRAETRPKQTPLGVRKALRRFYSTAWCVLSTELDSLAAVRQLINAAADSKEALHAAI